MAITKVTGDVIANDAIDHDQLANRYTASVSKTSATTVTCNKNNGDIFTWTLGHDVSVKFTNVKVGDIATLIITGGSSTYSITLPTADGINGASSTFNKISGDFVYTSGTKNLVEFKFISTSEAWYQISQIAS